MNSIAEEKFTRLCESLRRNDPSITSVATPNFAELREGYGLRLGQALQRNSFVTSLRLSLSSLLTGMDTYEEDTDVADALPLMEYIATSQSLKDVMVWDDEHSLAPTLIRLIFDAVGRNSSIEGLDAQIGIPLRHLTRLLQQTTSIKNLVFYADCSSHRDTNLETALQGLADALGANQTLERLWIACHSQQGNALAERVLPQLGAHPKLFHIMVGFGAGATASQYHTLAQFLRSTQSLEQLGLFQYKLDSEALQIIFTALQSNPVIKKLLLSGCLFDYASTQEFVRFFQDKKYKATPLVQELYIRPGYSMFGRNASSNRTPSVAEVTATMLVDSSLEVLDLDDELQQGANAEHFFDALISNSSQVSLVALHLDNLSTPSAEALSRFLRTTTTLQRLIVGNIAYNADREVVLSAIRQNGSLHSVNLQRGAASFFATEQKTRMEAFLERNKSVPLLLAKPSLKGFDGGDNDERDSGEKTDLLQFPALMTSSRSAPRMAPNSVLIGLLAVDAQSVEANGLSDASADREEDRKRHHKRPRLSSD